MHLDPDPPSPAGEAPPASASPRRRRPRVLVVNPARADRELYAGHLRGAGFDVLVAGEGLEALARAVAHRPDAIVMDMAMPSLDGWEIARRLKAAAATRDIPVIAMTGGDGHGAPLPPEELRAEVERQLGRTRPRPRRRGRAGRH